MPSPYGGSDNDPFDRVHHLAKAAMRVGPETIERAGQDYAINGIQVHAVTVDTNDGPEDVWSPEHQEILQNVVNESVGARIQAAQDAVMFGIGEPDYSGEAGEF